MRNQTAMAMRRERSLGIQFRVVQVLRWAFMGEEGGGELLEEFGAAEVALDFLADAEGDVAGFLADDDGDGVGGFGEADGGAVAEAHGAVGEFALADGEDASGGGRRVRWRG